MAHPSARHHWLSRSIASGRHGRHSHPHLLCHPLCPAIPTAPLSRKAIVLASQVPHLLLCLIYSPSSSLGILGVWAICFFLRLARLATLAYNSPASSPRQESERASPRGTWKLWSQNRSLLTSTPLFVVFCLVWCHSCAVIRAGCSSCR